MANVRFPPIADIRACCHRHVMVSVGVLLMVGFVAGGIIGLLLGSKRLGCGALALIPIGAIAYVSWWQDQHAENLRSTSGLEFIFVPIPPSIAALAGFGLVWLFRDWLVHKDLD